MNHIIEFDQKCTACKGTGIYIGFAERDGAGVVCNSCKGKGWYHSKIEYDDFEKLEIRPSVQRVYLCNPGICIGTGSQNKYKLEDFGGMPYQDWLEGQPFPRHSENRRFTCPAWWYQTADYKKKPDGRECAGSGSFSNCPSFKDKDSCWNKWDKEHTERSGKVTA